MPNFVDAQEMHRRHPDSFGVPADKHLAEIAPSMLIKVCDGDDRLWLKVIGVDGDKITGVVDS